MKLSPNFSKMIAGSKNGEVLIPHIRAALFDPDFPDFTVTVEGFTRRPPDGWFHPSTHPTENERVLYHYLVDPDEMLDSVRDPHSVMAVTQGTFWHDFVQVVLLARGVIKTNPNPTPGMNAAEWFWSDPKSRSRGHCDGITNPKVTGQPVSIFEFKSMGANRMRQLAKGDPDDPAVIQSFRKMAPEYYAQAQEYMRMSNIPRWVGVLMSIEYPYPMREVALTLDPKFVNATTDKYARVIEAAKSGTPPDTCCGKPKVCLAAPVCSIGKAMS